MKKPYIITAGEPAGIGPEIILKALRRIDEISDKTKYVIFGDGRLFARDDFPLTPIESVTEAAASPDRFFIKDHILPKLPTPGLPEPETASVTLHIIRAATLACLRGEAAGMVTAPVHKAVLNTVDPNFRGHTDHIADICAEFHGRPVTPVMMLACSELRAVPLTVHIPLHAVPKAITPEKLIKTAEIIQTELRDTYNIPSPRIALAGLNPHAGDGGVLGSEEREILLPAVTALRGKGINISDPLAADTMFHPAARARYDVALCMYHDQALIPVKTLGFDEGVNVTLGLPIRRASPDHGTAFDIAGKNIADEKSLLNAIKEML